MNGSSSTGGQENSYNHLPIQLTSLYNYHYRLRPQSEPVVLDDTRLSDRTTTAGDTPSFQFSHQVRVRGRSGRPLGAPNRPKGAPPAPNPRNTGRPKGRPKGARNKPKPGELLDPDHFLSGEFANPFGSNVVFINLTPVDVQDPTVHSYLDISSPTPAGLQCQTARFSQELSRPISANIQDHTAHSNLIFINITPADMQYYTTYSRLEISSTTLAGPQYQTARSNQELYSPTPADIQDHTAHSYLEISSPTPAHLQGETERIANNSSPTVTAGAVPPPLPPSVEEAYRKKCIELKRRMNEVEDSNDGLRLRKARLQRGIRKMRLERAYLLDILAKRMKKNGSSVDAFQGAYDEESEGSSEAPPTPHEKPLRSKRSHRRPISSPPPMSHQQHRPLAPSQILPTNSFDSSRDPFRESQYQHVPTTNGHPTMHFTPHLAALRSDPISPNAAIIRRGPQPPINPFEEFLIHHVLPNRGQFPYRTEDEGVQMAKEAWQDPALRDLRALCEQNFDRNMQKYEADKYEFERALRMEGYENREPEMEVQREPPPPQPSSRDGGAGGFTSING